MEIKVVIRDPRLKGYVDRIMMSCRGDEGLDHGISLLEYRYRGYEMNDEVWGGALAATKDGVDYLRKRVAAKIKNYVSATDKALFFASFGSFTTMPLLLPTANSHFDGSLPSASDSKSSLNKSFP